MKLVDENKLAPAAKAEVENMIDKAIAGHVQQYHSDRAGLVASPDDLADAARTLDTSANSEAIEAAQPGTC